MNGPDQVPIKVVKREIAFSASAKHNNIVQLIDVFAQDGAQLVIVVRIAASSRPTVIWLFPDDFSDSKPIVPLQFPNCLLSVGADLGARPP
jgi:hypothetical protein